MSEPLTTWRACALYASSLLDRAYLDPQLAPHLQALKAAMAQLQAADAAPMPPPMPQMAPQAAQPPPQAAQPPQQASPWAAPTPAYTPSPEPVAAAPSAEPAWMPPPPPRAPVATPAEAPRAPSGPVATQAEPPLAPMTVFTFGSNDKGLLGQGFMRAPNWEPAREITTTIGPVVAIAAGAGNFALITRSGQLLLTGSNASYLFADRQGKGRDVPSPIEGLQSRVASRVFFGATTTHLFAVLDGKLQGWGRQANALGVDLRSPALEPKPIERIGRASGGGGVSGEQVRQMALSRGHSVALLADGTVWMAGGNARGQLGQGLKGNPHETFVFAAPEGIGSTLFQAIACSAMHTACVAVDGSLYTCGRNETGELGHADLEDHYRLTRVTTGSIAGRRVVQVACSETATFCITEDGMLHGAGSNQKGTLGLGDAPGASQFTPLPLPEGKTVKQVSAGARHVLALAHDGSVYGWGDNYLGQALAAENGKPVTTPMLLRGFVGQRVVGVCAGNEHSAVLVGA
jgi:alpha-tubulin suppressor-like RCC1 family protein